MGYHVLFQCFGGLRLKNNVLFQWWPCFFDHWRKSNTLPLPKTQQQASNYHPWAGKHSLNISTHTYTPAYLPTRLPTYLPSYLFAYTYLLTYLVTYLPTYLPTYKPTYLPTSLPTYPPTYLYTYIHTHIFTNKLICTHMYIYTY